MNGSGFFFLHRSLWSSDSLTVSREGEARRIEAWIWFLAQANWADSRELLPGQFSTTRGRISAYTGWTDGKVRSWLKSLCKEGAISLKRNGNHSIVTVENWSEYQSLNRLDLGPSQVRARSELGPSKDQASSSSGADPGLAGSELGPSQVRARSELGPATREEEITNKQDLSCLISESGADGSASFALDGQSAPPAKRGVFDEAGNRWPVRKSRGDYPDAFGAIWEVWTRAATVSGRVTAGNKAKAYKLCREHISKGVTVAELRRASISYLQPFTHGSGTLIAQHAPTFFAASAGMWENHTSAEANESVSASGVFSLDAFGGDESFALQCAQAASMRLGMDRPEFSDGDGWDEFRKLPDDVQRVAVSIAKS